MAKPIDIRALLQTEIDKVGSQRALARKLGISAPYLSDVMLGRREPGDKILRPLGIVKTVAYTKVVTYQRDK